MSELNPYAKFLDGRPLEVILSATSHEIANKLQMIGHDKSSEPPAPGKWSPAEIVCHLADCEIAFALPPAPDSRGRPSRPAALRSGQVGRTLQRHSSQGRACRLHRSAQLESLAHCKGPARLCFQARHASRARDHDIPDHRRNHGWPRSESSRPTQAHRDEVSVCAQYRRACPSGCSTPGWSCCKSARLPRATQSRRLPVRSNDFCNRANVSGIN